jgi:branched-chain amino acid transport system ATP-binding protein
MSASPLLKVQGLTRRFGGLVAVSQVSFELAEGEIVGILGPNGAGKTTLFNLLTGFIPPNEGSVHLQGTDLRGMAPHKVVARGLARTFQLCRPFAGLSVLENVLVACYSPRSLAAFRQQAGLGREQHALTILEQVGLAAKAHTPSEMLSYGDQRRLEIARALATDPKLLLLDEPFAGLGSSEIAPLSALIRKLHSERGVSILIIEHKLREFMQLVQRVIAIDFGEVIATGTPEEIVRHPAVIEAYIGKEEVDLGPA